MWNLPFYHDRIYCIDFQLIWLFHQLATLQWLYCFLVLLHSWQGGDPGTKRAKVDQDVEERIAAEPIQTQEKVLGLDLQTSSGNLKCEASTSGVDPTARTEEPGVDQLPKEMHEMTIKDDKVDDLNDKVEVLNFASSLL